jgi:hypothetical protein
LTLATFYSDVSAAIGRGTSLDARIPRWTRLAARQLENDYNYVHMWRVGTFDTDPAATDPSLIPFPADVDIKAVVFAQPILFVQGKFQNYGKPLKNVEAVEVTALSQGLPSGYWVDEDGLHLDVVPESVYSMRWGYWARTTWPTDTGQTPALLRRGEGVLFAQTMLFAAAEIRDPRLKQVWEDPNSLVALPMQLSALQRADEDFKNTNKDWNMQYVPQGGW